MLSFTRRLIALRQQSPALHSGEYGLLHDDGAMLAYSRELGEERYLVVLNFSGQARDWRLPEPFAGARVVLSTHDTGQSGQPANPILLNPHEGVILR